MKSQESKSSNFYNIQSPFCVDQLIIAVASLVLHNIWRSDQSDSTPDIPGKILLPGPRKWTKVTRPSLAVGERCGLGTRLYSSMAQSDQSPEYLAVRGRIAAINRRVPNADLPSFSSELLQAGLITDATHRAAIALTGSSADREIASLTAVAMEAIRVTPGLFNSFVDILETRDREIASTLRYECCEYIQCIEPLIKDTPNIKEQLIDFTSVCFWFQMLVFVLDI